MTVGEGGRGRIDMGLGKAKMDVSLPQGIEVPLSGVQSAGGAPVMVEVLP